MFLANPRPGGCFPDVGGDSARIGAARGVAGAMRSKIAEKHAVYLKSGNDYTATDIVNGSRFGGGAATPTIASNVITWNSGPSTSYSWTYTPRNGVEVAYLTENNGSAFP